MFLAHLDNKKIFTLFAIFTVGFPFVGYKALCGFIFLHFNSSFFDVAGFLMLAVAAIDLILNTTNFICTLFNFERRVDVCLLSTTVGFLMKKCRHDIDWKEVGTAIDMLFAFSIVAWVVGVNMFPHFPYPLLMTWNICTVINVLGAGLSRIGGVLVKT